MRGIDEEDGVELANSFSSRKNARNIFIPASNFVINNTQQYYDIKL